ncbi:MAG: ADP-forming succinate--CoA ligase subunit beta, partial [Verrucomicrobiota bacterium]|nr:ADP-forming succinate--CoA ligase subunit beta [Verrucomicrobiota bacterium]
MNIHEYQAKHLLQEYGVRVPRGYAATNPLEVETALSNLGGDMIVVKAQIHAGGRGKGTFTDGYKGGVKVVKTPEAAREVANRMLGNTLVTAQTGPEGRKVQTLYLTEGCDIEHEYYLAIVLDRETAQSVIIASTEGGMDIEEVADKTPEKLIRVPVSPTMGLRSHQCRQVAFALGFKGEKVKQFGRILTGVYKMFWEKNALLVEINPLVSDNNGNLSALDAKVSFDGNAIFQHPDIEKLRDLNEEDPKEIDASKHDLAYIALDGNIACMVNGAGLAMATMDIIQSFGGSPANFLDVGGGANEAQVTAAFKIILSDPNVKGILVNIFGGIMKCDVIANGIVAAAKNVDMTIP